MTWLLLLAVSACAQTPVVEIRASTGTAQLGQAVELTATARFPAEGALRLNLEKSATDYFAVVKVEDKGHQDAGGIRTQSLRLEVLPLAVGPLSLPLTWTFASPKGNQDVQSPPVRLNVPEPPLQGQGEIAGIKGPLAAWPALWPWLLAAALLWGAYELWKRRRPAALEALSPVPIDSRPPEVVASEELARLESSGLWSEGRYKEFYIRLTDILRQYLERRYGVPATRLTTPELSRHLRMAEIDRLVTVMFRDLFDRADLVKFAKVAPEPDWGAKDLDAARRVVRETTPESRTPQGAPA